MSAKIPDSHLQLVAGPVYAVFTTLTPSGRPQNSVVWCSWDGAHVLVNSRGDSQKVKNLRTNPRVALTAVDPENPYRWVDVRGTVEEIVEDGDFSNINAHAKLYMGKDEYYGGVAPIDQKGRDQRFILKIKPEQVFVFPRRP